MNIWKITKMYLLTLPEQKVEMITFFHLSNHRYIIKNFYNLSKEYAHMSNEKIEDTCQPLLPILHFNTTFLAQPSLLFVPLTLLFLHFFFCYHFKRPKKPHKYSSAYHFKGKDVITHLPSSLCVFYSLHPLPSFLSSQNLKDPPKKKLYTSKPTHYLKDKRVIRPPNPILDKTRCKKINKTINKMLNKK